MLLIKGIYKKEVCPAVTGRRQSRPDKEEKKDNGSK
jgi:hypothetical protein